METSFTVEMQELKKHINFVSYGLGNSKTDLPVMLLRFEVVGNKAVIFASDKEMFCRTEMRVNRPDDAKDGIFAVLGGKIERLITQVNAENVTFTSDGENLEIKAGFLTVNFELFDGSVLKTVEQGVKEHLELEGLAVDRAGLQEAVAYAKTCSTTSSIRPEVNHAELRDGKFLSSDGRKIMIYGYVGFPKEMTLKVPASIITPFLGAIRALDEENVSVVEGKSYYYVKAGKNKFTLGIRKVERSFPAVEKQLATLEGLDDEVAIDNNVFAAMLRGVSLGLPSDEVKVQVDLAGAGRDSTMEISSINTVGRRSYERASCGRKSETDSISFPVSFKHLLDSLNVFKGDSVVDLLIQQKRNLLMIRDSTESREVLTVIPFRTESAEAEERKEREVAAEARKASHKTEEPAEKKEEESGDLDDTALDI